MTFSKSLLLGWLCCLSLNANASELKLLFDGAVRPGVVYIELFDADNAKQWHDEPLARKSHQLGSTHTTYVLFEALDPGRYAVRAYLDLNANAQLDTNGMGYPTEPVAFSRVGNERSRSRSFLSTVFILGPKPGTLTLNFIEVVNQEEKSDEANGSDDSVAEKSN